MGRFFGSEGARTDIVIPCAVDANGRSVILGAVLAVWPSAFLEDAEGVDKPVQLVDVEVGALRDEFFVYRDAVALNAWNEEGGTDENTDSMIHVLLGLTAVTCVVDHREGTETRAIVERIERGLGVAT